MDPFASRISDEPVQIWKKSQVRFVTGQAAAGTSVFLKELPRAVRGAIIANDQLEVVKILREHRFNCLFDIRAAIVRREDDGNRRTRA